MKRPQENYPVAPMNKKKAAEVANGIVMVRMVRMIPLLLSKYLLIGGQKKATTVNSVESTMRESRRFNLQLDWQKR
jgi:hypothetical protein